MTKEVYKTIVTRAKTWWKKWSVEGDELCGIYFYNDNQEIVAKDDCGYLDGVDYIEVVKPIKCKNITDETKRNAYIIKKMAEKVNFTFVNNNDSEKRRILYLYVDNQEIKIKTVKKYIDTHMFGDAHLLLTVLNKKQTEISINKKTVVIDETESVEKKENEKHQEQLNKIYEKLRAKCCLIDKEDVARIFNHFELIEREKPLLFQYKDELEQEM